MYKIALVIIDPQNSFCKQVDPKDQQIIHDGELCVPGAWEDMLRVANLIKTVGNKLYDIHITMDCHHLFHIAHPAWWKDSKGNPPGPFTIMSEQNGEFIGSQLINGSMQEVGKYSCSVPSTTKWTVHYLQTLKTNGKYPHCIWPPHCLIGTPGNNVVEPLMEAILEWESNQKAVVTKVTKGSNLRVEHFSAIKAEVEDPEDYTTSINDKFIKTLMKADELWFAGEAGSHCLANTVRDIADSSPNDEFIKKCTLLLDGTSPVPGFENLQDQFIKDMEGRGMKTASIDECIKKLS